MAVVDDSQIGESLSPHSEKHAEILSTSTESGSVIVDVVRQAKPSEGMGGVDYNAARESTKPDWQLDSTEEGKTLEPPHLDPVLIYTPTGSMDSPPTTPAGSMESYEGRDRLLSSSPRKKPHVFTMRESESSDIVGSAEIAVTEVLDVPQSQNKKGLHFEKPELGVSPAEHIPASSLPGQSQWEQKGRGETKYLSSSEMYRLASDEESVQSLNVDDHEDHTEEQKTEPAAKDHPQHHSITPAKKAERPKSLPFHILGVDPPVIRESPEFALERVFPEQDRTDLTLSLDSGSRRAHQLPGSARSPKPRGAVQSEDSSPQAPKKPKLKKSSSISSPIRNKRSLDHSSHSPFTSPRQGRSSMAVKSKEAEDRPGYMGMFGDPKKSSSSPELSSPPAVPKVVVLAKTEASRRTSRSRMVPHLGGPQSISQSSKSAPLPGDLSDTGPKEPPILVTPSESYRYPLDPCFVFLQLYHASFLGPSHEKPQPLPDGEVIERAIKCLDRIPPYDTHKIGVIYVGPGQHDNEAAILRNVYGSSRYMTFLAGLGTLVRLRDCPPAEIYTGGLDRNGEDGEFAYSWQDDICQVIFHIATLMPTRESDPGCNSKKMHIGNDFVTIVYNDSQQTVKFGTIKGQFNFAEVLIKPLDNASNMVTVRFKDELKDLLTDIGPRVISDDNLPRLVRQLVVHINMASVIHQSQKRPTDAYGCNWLERLRQIKRVRTKAAAENFSVPSSPIGKVSPSLGLRPSSLPLAGLTDFTEYVMK